MNAAEIAASMARGRTGMTLIDYAEVGLPCWRILARCDVLAKKPISAIDETILRAISLEVREPRNLQLLLGLEEPVFEGAVVGLMAEGWVEGSPDTPLILTPAGSEVLASAVELVSEERVVPFIYDGMLRRPVSIGDAMEPRRSRRLGIREVPPTPARPPDLAELSKCRSDLVRILRTLRGGRDQETELLAIRGWDRRDRLYRPAIAFVFVPESGRGAPQISFVVDEEESVEHEAAFASGVQLDRLGVKRALRSRRRTPLRIPGPRKVRNLLDPEAEKAAREQVFQAERAAEQDRAGKSSAVARDLRNARRNLGSISPRIVLPHEHPALLEVAMGTTQSRMIIFGGNPTHSHVDSRFVGKLRAVLDRGAEVRISLVAQGSGESGKALFDLARDYPRLNLDFNRSSGEDSLLVSDAHLAVQGSYPWLGHLGDAERELGDCRSLVWTDAKEIADLLEQVGIDAPPRRRRRRRRPRQRANDE